MAKSEVQKIDWQLNHSRSESWRSAFDQTERRHDDKVNTIGPSLWSPLTLFKGVVAPFLKLGTFTDRQQGWSGHREYRAIPGGPTHIWAGWVLNWTSIGPGDNGECRDSSVGVQPPNAGQHTAGQAARWCSSNPPGQVRVSCLVLQPLDRFAKGYHTRGNHPWQPSSKDSLRALKSLYHGQVERCLWEGRGHQGKDISLC